MSGPQAPVLSALLARFRGANGKRLLIEALGKQPMLRGDPDLQTQFAEVAELHSFGTNDLIIKQGDTDTEFYFIVVGSVIVSPGGRPDTQRTAGSHVGEMAAIDPTTRRSANVTAAEPSVLAKVSERRFSEIANRHPNVWRILAQEIASRLRARVLRIEERRSVPRLFIASSKEGLAAAGELASLLKNGGIFDTAIWTDENIFVPGMTNVEALEVELARADFAVLFLTPDDLTSSRGKRKKSPRDNVIFELGLFSGVLGRRRAVMACPHGEALKIPSDLTGVSPLVYEQGKIADTAEKITRMWAPLGAR